MRIAVLGPLEVLTDDSTPVPLPGATERLLLAVLTAGAPAAVGTDRLLAALGDDVSDAARESLRVSLGRLRAALEPALPPRSSGQYVLRRGPGYVLAVPRSDIDAVHVADLTRHGRARLAEGDAAEAVRVLTSALHLWRGVPYADWPDAAFAEAERCRLTTVRADAETALREAAGRLVTQPAGLAPSVPRFASSADGVRTFVPLPRLPHDDEHAPPVPAPAAPSRPPPRGRRTRSAGLAALVVAVLVAGGLAVRSNRAAESVATAAEERLELEAEANALAAVAPTVGSLDRALLLSVQAFRLAETPETRSGLLAAVAALGRVDRAMSFPGAPREPMLSGGGASLSFSTGTAIVTWPVGRDTVPHVLMDVPATWGAWLLAAPSPTDDELMVAGVADGVPWLRMTTTVAQSRLLLDGDRIGGWPLDGMITADGRRALLVVAEPDPTARESSSSWRLIDVAVADRTTRDTGVAGTFPAPVDQLVADLADDAGSFVLWAADGWTPATLVDVSGGGSVPIAPYPRPFATTSFRALPEGAAQLFADGLVVLVDGTGTPVQELDAHSAPVRDVVVAPDGTWAVTAGDGAEVRRWPIEPSSGQWLPSESLIGHLGDVAGAAVDPTGETLFTVARDGTLITWAMTLDGVVSSERAQRGPGDEAAALDDACAVVGRDLTRGEWTRYLSGRPWEPTCTDLP